MTKRLTRGQRLRREIENEFSIEGVAASALIEQICHTADEIEALEDALAKHGSIVEGARGQIIANPALASLARHRATFAALMSRAFPEDETPTTKRARAAAHERWRQEGVR